MLSIKRLRISQKLPITIIALNLASALCVATVSLMHAKDIVYNQAQEKLDAAETGSLYD